MLHEILDHVSKEATEIIDIDRIMREAMIENRGLMGEVLLKMVRPEFKFIEMSGLYFGFLFGILQMIAWIFYPVNWVLPVAGFLVGYITNWMALTLIFEPATPKKIGPFILQGLFIKRQKEVAGQFANVICDRVLNPDNMINFLKEEPARSKLKNILEEQINKNMNSFEKDPMVGMLASPEKLQEARTDLDRRLNDNEFDNNNRMIRELSTGNNLMRDQIHESLERLDSSDFNGILRPVFQKDEWKLMLVGGVLGVVIGALQVVFIFGGSF